MKQNLSCYYTYTRGEEVKRQDILETSEKMAEGRRATYKKGKENAC